MSKRNSTILCQHEDLLNPASVIRSAFCVLWAKAPANRQLMLSGPNGPARDFWCFSQLAIPFIHQATGGPLESLVSRGVESDQLYDDIAILLEPGNLKASEERILDRLTVLPDDLARLIRYILEAAECRDDGSLRDFWKWRHPGARDVLDVLTPIEMRKQIEPMMVKLLREILPSTGPEKVHGSDTFLEPWRSSLIGDTMMDDYDTVNLLSVGREAKTGQFDRFEVVDLRGRSGFVPYLGWVYSDSLDAADGADDSLNDRKDRIFLDSVNLRTVALLFAQENHERSYGPLLDSFLKHIGSDYGSDVTTRANTIEGWDRDWIVNHLVGLVESQHELQAVLESSVRRHPGGSGLVHPTLAGHHYYYLTRSMYGDLWALRNCSTCGHSEMLQCVKIQKLISIGAAQPWELGTTFNTRLNHHVFTARALFESDPADFLQQTLQDMQNLLWSTDEVDEWLEHLVDMQTRTLLDVRRLVSEADSNLS